MQERFNREGGLLLATDAAAEGLNLHHRCHLVVNYELPWNPARLEQRIGRVDRIGQRRTVHALTLTARDTAEDLVIRNLARRLARIVATLGPGDRLGAFLDDARTAGIVIGDDPFDLPVADDRATVPIIRIDGTLEKAAAAATQLSSRRAMADLRPHHDTGFDILVGHMDGRGGSLAPGYVVVATCRARTNDGFLIAERQVVLHLAAAAEKPRTADAARSVARRLLRVFDMRAAASAVDCWFADVQGAHEAAVRHRVARELELRDRGGSAAPCSPASSIDARCRRPTGPQHQRSSVTRCIGVTSPRSSGPALCTLHVQRPQSSSHGAEGHRLASLAVGRLARRARIRRCGDRSPSSGRSSEARRALGPARSARQVFDSAARPAVAGTRARRDDRASRRTRRR